MEHKGPLWLLESAADAMLIIDSTERIVLANRPAGALFGHAQADLLVLSFEDLAFVPAAERQPAVVDDAPPGPQRPAFPPKTTSVCP